MAVAFSPGHRPPAQDDPIQGDTAAHAVPHERQAAPAAAPESPSGEKRWRAPQHNSGNRHAVGPTGGQRVELNSAGGVTHKRLEADDRIRLLVDELGMKGEIVQRLPLDTPTPPPPWSRTARNAS